MQEGSENKLKSTTSIPNKAIQEITFMLYNYYRLDEIIKQNKRNIVGNMNMSASAWRKGVKEYNNTFENQIAKSIDMEFRISKWKKVLREFFKNYKKSNSNIDYAYIELKYFQKQSTEEIADKIELNKKEQSAINNRIIALIFYFAVDSGLY